MGLPESCSLQLFSNFPKGARNLISDVPGVTVGHCTLRSGEINTGVTAIIPHPGDTFHDKLTAAVSVLNGFGKSTGLIQIEELGTLETPILMTNTLSVGTALTALVKYMLERNADIGVDTGTVNCVVTECNDGELNDIRGLHVTEEHAFAALASAEADFAEGCVGAGSGMCCLGFKGGIGSASRVVEVDGQKCTIGALVLSNFGAAGHLVIGGDHIGRRLNVQPDAPAEKADDKDKGSIIIVLATDVPLNERQLERVARRSMVSLGRVGSYCGNGSGDIAIAFSTGNRVPHYSSSSVLPTHQLYNDDMDRIFEAAIEAAEEAIVSSLYHAETTTGFRGKTVKSLREYL